MTDCKSWISIQKKICYKIKDDTRIRTWSDIPIVDSTNKIYNRISQIIKEIIQNNSWSLTEWTDFTKIND